MRDEEWAFVVPYLTLMMEAAPQRRHEVRAVFNGLRSIVKTGRQWRWMPTDLPPWEAVSQQTRRWLAAGCFEGIAADRRVLRRLAAGRTPPPRAAIFDRQTLQSPPARGARAGYDGAKRRKGSKIHVAVDTLGHRLALPGPPADDQDRAPVEALAAAVQAATRDAVDLTVVDQGDTGAAAAAAAAAHGIQWAVIKLSEVKRGFVLRPRRWVIDRSCACKSRFRRRARDYARRASPLAGLHGVAFAVLILRRLVSLVEVHNRL